MKRKIIFISGWGFKADIFDEVAKELRDFDISCEEPSLRGAHFATKESQTNSARIPATASMTSSRNDATTALIGWSFGGLAALQLYSNFPELFSHLILISSTPRFMSDGNWKGMSALQADKQFHSAKINMQKYQQQFLRLAIYPDKSKQIARNHMHADDNENLLPQLHSLFHTDMRDEFSKLTVPVMQIIAENDMIVRPEQSMQSSQLLNHTIHTIPQAGHMFLKTHTYEVSTRIKEFIC
jgi:pimeloyl-[acyl-carrier protein] methyl ester esterase